MRLYRRDSGRWARWGSRPPRKRRKAPVHSESVLDEPIPHFPVIPFLTTRSPQVQTAFSRVQLPAPLDRWLSYALLWVFRIRGKSGADQVCSVGGDDDK
jgi:hypothetical protein